MIIKYKQKICLFCAKPFSGFVVFPIEVCSKECFDRLTADSTLSRCVLC